MKFLLYLILIKVSVFANKDVYPYLNMENNQSVYNQFHRFKMDALVEQKYIPVNGDLYKDYIANNINVNDNLTTPQKDILEDTAYIQVGMIATIGVLLILPESVTKWDTDSLDDKPLSEKWKENVEAGPILDEDELAINYLGHPVSGAIYYAMARNDGLDPFESFLFSTLMSTFFWEYGYEAFAEIPSIQDLVSTPIVGAFMGEYMHYLEGELDKNSGVIWNSKYLGNVSYFFLDPMGNMAEGISDFLDLSVTMKFNTYQESSYVDQDRYNVALSKPVQFNDFHYGVVLNFEF